MFELAVINGKMQGHRLLLPVEKPIIVGREADCALSLPSPQVSRQHCELRHVARGMWVRDLASQNGTYVNEVAITEPTLLVVGDHLRIGPMTFELQPWQAPEDQVTLTAPPEEKRRPHPVSLAARTRRQDVSDDDIADWLTDADTTVDHPLANGDTAIISKRSTDHAPAANGASSSVTASSPATPVAPSTSAPPAPAKGFRTLQEEAADIIRRHRESHPPAADAT